MTSPEQALGLTDAESGALSMIFQFEHMDLDTQPGQSKWAVQPWRLTDLKQTITRWQRGLAGRGWNSNYLSNHDQPRALSRFGDDAEFRVQSATLLATFLHTLQGTPYIYQGEEIGMTNVRFESIDEYRDIETLNMYREAVDQRGQDPAEVLRSIYAKGRDNARTPMQWDASPNAGFSTGAPWIAVNPNYTTINAAADRADPDGVFAYYQRLIRLRKQHPILVYGDYQLLLPDDPAIYAYTRSWQGRRLLVLLNFSGEAAEAALPDGLALDGAELLIGNYPIAGPPAGQSLALRPYEARVYVV